MVLYLENSLYQGRRPHPFTRRQRSLDPFGEHFLLLIPGAGPAQAPAQLSFAQQLSCLCLERLSKEGVIAIPRRLATQRLQEEARALYLPECLRAVPASGDSITKRGRHAAEQAGLQQEDLPRFGLR